MADRPDTFTVNYGDVQMQIDFGAERLLAAERDAEKIAVEVKSFINPSAISEFHTAKDRGVNKKIKLFVLISSQKAHINMTPADVSIYSPFVG